MMNLNKDVQMFFLFVGSHRRNYVVSVVTHIRTQSRNTFLDPGLCLVQHKFGDLETVRHKVHISVPQHHECFNSIVP